MTIRKEVIGECTLYLGDCVELMPRLGGSADLVLTDPPFFMPADHYQSRVKHGRTWSDTSILSQWWSGVCNAMNPLLKPSSHVAVFCNCDSYAAFYPPMFSRWAKLKALVWDKGHVGLGRIFRNQHELIIWARQPQHYFHDDGMLRADVFTFKATPPSEREHPVEKPADMLAYILTPLCPESGVVLDPFMGSGTTGAACMNTGRKFVGIESEPKYFDIACKRLEAMHKLPLMEACV